MRFRLRSRGADKNKENVKGKKGKKSLRQVDVEFKKSKQIRNSVNNTEHGTRDSGHKITSLFLHSTYNYFADATDKTEIY